MATVLVVNDDRDMLDVYESALLAMGHEPITRATIKTGPETIRQVGAEALLVDLQSPDDDQFGLRIIEAVRDDPDLRALPIILATGASGDVASLRARLGDLRVPVLIKPFEVGTLEDQIRIVLNGHPDGRLTELA